MFAFQGLLLALHRARAHRPRPARRRQPARRGRRRCSRIRRRVISRPVQSPRAAGQSSLTIAPYDTFDTADGVLVLAVGNDAQWRRCCATLGLASLGARRALRDECGPRRALRRAAPGARGRTPARASLDDLVDDAARRPACRAAPCDRSPRRSRDPQIIARAMVETVDAPDDRAAAGARHAGEAVGHARQRPHAAAAARRAHRVGAERATSEWSATEVDRLLAANGVIAVVEARPDV